MQHQQEVENLTLSAQPIKTLKFFILAIVQYVKRSLLYLLAKGGWLMLLSTVAVAIGILVIAIDGPHEKVSSFCITVVFLMSNIEFIKNKYTKRGGRVLKNFLYNKYSTSN